MSNKLEPYVCLNWWSFDSSFLWIDFRFKTELELVIIGLENSSTSNLDLNFQDQFKKAAIDLETKLHHIRHIYKGPIPSTLVHQICKLKLSSCVWQAHKDEL